MAVLQQLDTSWLDQSVWMSFSQIGRNCASVCLNEKPKFTVWVVNGDALWNWISVLINGAVVF